MRTGVSEHRYRHPYIYCSDIVIISSGCLHTSGLATTGPHLRCLLRLVLWFGRSAPRGKWGASAAHFYQCFGSPESLFYFGVLVLATETPTATGLLDICIFTTAMIGPDHIGERFLHGTIILDRFAPVLLLKRNQKRHTRPKPLGFHTLFVSNLKTSL